MALDRDLLSDKIHKLNPISQKFIIKRELDTKEFLFILSKDYPNLPPQILYHEKIKLPKEILDKFIEEMKKDSNLRAFLCTDLQHFLSLFENYNKFYQYFYWDFQNLNINSEEECRKIIRDINNTCLEELDEENSSINLKVINFLGFIMPNSKLEKIDLDEPKKIFAKLLELYYYKSSRKLVKDSVITFANNILRPLEKIANILGIASSFDTDGRQFIFFNEEKIKEKLIQDFFCFLQYHCFFEEYVNSLFEGKGDLIKNPLVVFNPSEELFKKRVSLHGYFELDGSLYIKGNKEIFFIECKNGDRVHPNHLTEFLGKVIFIEKVYGIKARKLLFSTGKRYPIWDNIEDFPSCSDISIFCNKSFLDNFSKAKSLISKKS